MNQNTSTSTPSSFLKLLPTLLALALPIAFAASCTSGDATPENIDSVGEALSCNCLGGPVTCPQDNPCGEWSCDTTIKACSAVCVFNKKLGEGDQCETGSGNAGVCMQNDAGNGLICCGCYDKEAGRCYDGTGPLHCGIQGNSCQTCEAKGPCTVPTCEKGECGVDSAPKEGLGCDDNNVCTTGTKCDGGKCTGGNNANCSDDDPCTQDPCDPQEGCNGNHPAVPNSPATNCSDNSVCTGAGSPDQCVNGSCQGGPAVVCDDSNECTTDSCDAETGCVHTSLPEDTPCTTDGSSCTTNDRCKDDDNNPNTPRKCRGDGTFCFENNPCASHDCEGDACPANPTFLPNDTQCSTGDVCKLDQTCQSGVCTGGTDVPQDDFNPCTIDGCNPVTGVFHIAVGNSATVLCDDADPCTQNDKCDGDVCEGTPITCTPLDSCHKAGSCNSEDGTCSDPRQPDGTTCETTGKCETGVCVGGSVVEPGEGGAGGEPSNATGGDNGTGNETSTGGENASGGTAGEGATSSGGSAGTETDPNKQGGIYARDPGGCSCSVPGASNERRAGGALGLLFLAGAALLRRRRAA